MRALQLTPDPKSATGGSTYDDLTTGGTVPAAWPAMTIAVPGEDFQVNPGVTTTDRKSTNFGRRGNTPSTAWAAAPSLTGQTLATPKMLKAIIPRASGTVAAPTGTAPAPVTTAVTTKQSGVLPSLCAELIREEETDRVSGLWVDSWDLTLPGDGEGNLTFDMLGLYHEVSETVGSPSVASYAGHDYGFSIRSAKFYDGPDGEDLIDCIASAKITYNNGLIKDTRARNCAGKNLVEREKDGKLTWLWYPNRSRLGPQTIALTLDFGSVSAARELDRLFAAAGMLVVEATAGPAGTTPDSRDLVRFTVGAAALNPSDGGPDPLKKDGEIYSSYSYEGGIDLATGQDLKVEFAGATAVTV